MKGRVLLAATVAALLFAAPALALNVSKTRIDTSDHPKSKRVVVHYTASSTDTVWWGYDACIVSIQDVTADSVHVTPYGDPACKILGGGTELNPFNWSKTVANPTADRPCVDWGAVTVTPTGYDFGWGGFWYVVFGGCGQDGYASVVISTVCGK